MDDRSEQEQKKKGSPNWIGVLFFLALIIGPQLVGFLSQFISQVSGGAITVSSSTLFPILIGGLVVLSVVVMLVRSMAGINRGSEARLPTTLNPAPARKTLERSRAEPRIDRPAYPSPPPSSITGEPSSLDVYMRQARADYARLQQSATRTDIGSGGQQMRRTPQFEPIIDGRILGYGFLGLLLLGGLFVGVVWLAGGIP